MKSRFSYQKKWILFSIFLLLFLLIAWTILRTESFWFDQMIFSWIDSLHTPVMTRIFKFITGLVSFPALVVFTVIIYWNGSTRKNGNVVVLNLTLAYIFNFLLKLMFARERPFGISLIQESGYSFPSGHSMVSMAYFGFLIYLIYHSRFSRRNKWILMIFFGLLIFLIGLSRIYLGVHYPSDVVGGFFLSLAYLILFTHCVCWYQSKREV